MIVERPCVACGGLVAADPGDPGPGVLAHIRSERHRVWSRQITRTCPDCRIVTIPGDRDRCRGCRRTLELAGAA